ncbi:hypothetical protein [Mesorhizobium sp. ANAO-SY3R2]|uniref:hypothetical protein n=1 Tax=Mesorhizobium sp. ANAO-SY3R2 TaxID=3166644 RepID=UPI00366EB7E2
MRTLPFIAAVIVASSIGTSAIKSLLQPSDWYTAQERLLARYNANPAATLNSLAASFLKCADSKNSGTSGAAEIRTLAAKGVILAIAARIQGLDETEFKRRRIELLQLHLPDIKRKVDERDAENLLAYLKDLGEAGMAYCAVSYSA